MKIPNTILEYLQSMYYLIGNLGSSNKWKYQIKFFALFTWQKHLIFLKYIYVKGFIIIVTSLSSVTTYYTALYCLLSELYGTVYLRTSLCF